jgi:hypothetical protein
MTTAPVRRSVRSYGAKGDGTTDDSSAFFEAFRDESVDEIVLEDTASGAGYWLDMGAESWRPLILKRKMRVIGEGWGSRMVRGGEFVPRRPLFRNRDMVNGDDGIEFDGVCLVGRWDQLPKGVAWIGPHNPMMVVLRIQSSYTQSGKRVDAFRMERCVVRNWPGVLLAGANLAAAYFAENDIGMLSGGGFIFRYRCNAITCVRNRILRTCDDTLAFNATEEPRMPDAESGPAIDCLSRDNAFSRFNPEWAGGSATGPVVSVRGGVDIVSRGDVILEGPGEGVNLLDWMETEVRIHNMTIRDTAETPLRVTDGCRGIARVRLEGTAAEVPIENKSPDFQVEVY